MASSGPSATRQPRRILGVSTKMYFSAAKTRQYVDDVLRHLAQTPELLGQVDVFIVPDHVTLASVVDQLRSPSHSSSSVRGQIWTGAQDAFYEDAGAYTGEVSPAVLAEVGCRLVEVGHAERRRLFGETDDVVARKAAAAARHGMVPLVCIGERTRYDKDDDDEKNTVVDAAAAAAAAECLAQVAPVVAAVPDDAEILLAYEPVWAIGAAEPAGADHVVRVAQQIRQADVVRRRRGLTRIIYGGSAGPGLYEKLKDGLDGLFLGRFAHDPSQFYRTVQEVATA